MLERGNKSDRQVDLLRPLARKSDTREPALRKEHFVAVRELLGLLCGTIHQTVRPGIHGLREEGDAWSQQ